MNIVDARNELCPKPLIMAKRALNEAKLDEKFLLLINNETSKDNVERFLTENKIFFATTVKEGVYELTISKTKQELSHPSVEDFCSVEKKNNPQSKTMIVMNKNSIGHGPQELTAKLIEGFFTTIAEVPEKPHAIAFYNSGIHLCLNDSPVLNKIKMIQETGTKILVCGTCVDFHNAKAQVGVGVISNMLDILGAMEESTKVFTP